MAKVIEHLPQRTSSVGLDGDRGNAVAEQHGQPAATLKTLAREDLREIVRRLAQGERPGTAHEPISSKG